MNKIKAKTLWFIILASFILAIGLIVGCAYTDGALNTFLIVLLVINFIFITIAIQAATLKTFKYKGKSIKYPTKDYFCDIDLYKKLKELKFDERKVSYGQSFLLIDGKQAYKVVLVNDMDAYLDNSAIDNKGDGNKKLNQCNRFLGVEIFYDTNEEDLKRLPDYSIQAANIYYTALSKIENGYRCHNFLEPMDNHKEALVKLLEMLEFKEKEASE